jgi:hypothetical protein
MLEDSRERALSIKRAADSYYNPVILLRELGSVKSRGRARGRKARTLKKTTATVSRSIGA